MDWTTNRVIDDHTRIIVSAVTAESTNRLFDDAYGSLWRNQKKAFHSEQTTVAESPSQSAPESNTCDMSKEMLARFGSPVHFRKLDTNNDGYISEKELKAALCEIDSGKGPLTRDDRKAVQFMLDHFKEIAVASNDQWGRETAIHRNDILEYARQEAENRANFPRQPGDYLRVLHVDGVRREFIVHVPPAYDGNNKLPVVLFFHNLFGNGKNVAEFTKITSKADQEGFIVVYPNGTGWAKNQLRSWNVGRLPIYRNDDCKFIEKLIDTVEQNMSVDNSRIYAAGFSNGGMMAHEVAGRFSNRLAAMACISGCMTGKEQTPKEPVPTLLIHGTKDRLVPYDGRHWQTRLGLPAMKSLSFARDFWTKNNRTTTCSTENITPCITKEVSTGDRAGACVVTYTIKGARHGYPGSKDKSIDGPVCQEIDATDILWDFFSKHSKTPAK